MAGDTTNSPRVTAVPRARGTSENAAPGLLQRAWRTAGETGAPALALAVRDDGFEVIWVNRAATDLLGVDPTEVVGLGLRDLSRIGADPSSELAWARVAREVLQGTGGQREGAVRRLDGSEVRVQVSTHPLPVRPGEDADGWLVNLHPLTDMAHDIEAALREAEHRFTALAAAAPIGIMLSEAGMRLGYVNDRFVELTGMERHTLLGTGWLDAVVRDDLPELYDAGSVVLSGVTADATVRLDVAGDRQRWVHLRFAPTTTPARAAGFIGIAEDVTDRRAWEEQITYQAQHDPLTGLVNRRRLIEVLTELLGSKRTADRQFAVLFLDLDGFKEVNDTYGHEAGDRVLIEVSRRLQRTARENDLLARVAGDEFVVILRGVIGSEDAEAAARRQLDALAAPYRVARTAARLSASIGVALPATFDTPETLLRAADRVMYDAKQSGPGQYRVAPLVGGTRPEVAE